VTIGAGDGRQHDNVEHSNECSICGSEYDEDAGGLKGYFGICPVTFCEWCLSSLMDMLEQLRETDMKTEEEIRERLEAIEEDERLGYPPAAVQINAPLALIQTSLGTERDTLKWVLSGGE